MNKRDYPSLHLDKFKVKEQLALRKDMNVNEHDTIQHYTQKQIKVKKQLVVRKDMNVNEYDRLSSTTRRHKLK